MTTTPSTDVPPTSAFTKRTNETGRITYLSNELDSRFSSILDDGRFGPSAMDDFSKFESSISVLPDLSRARAYKVLAEQLQSLEPDTESGLERHTLAERSSTLASLYNEGEEQRLQREHAWGLSKRETSTAYLKATGKRLDQILDYRSWTEPTAHVDDRPVSNKSATGSGNDPDAYEADSSDNSSDTPKQSTNRWTSRLVPAALALTTCSVAAWGAYEVYNYYASEQA